jgi:oxygen-independent coproporphyrinogen-3 oxidase
MLLPDDPPRAAYVHVPFCRHRCGYCNFTLIAGRDDLIAAYLEALSREMQTLPPEVELDSLFLGGGTPTHLPPNALHALLSLLRRHFRLTAQAEFSIEANPLDLTPERARVLREFGVNRISLGVQSFRDEKLAALERDHRQEDILAAVALATEISPRVSIDLIFATPQETLEQWLQDVQATLATGVGHVSTYGLTIEPGSAFYGRLQRGQLQRSPEAVEASMYEQGMDLLQAAGFEHYEVSNFARPGERSRHNKTYWRGRSYYAFGSGASRYVQGRRETNHRSTTTYLQRVLAGLSPVAESETLLPEDRARERLVFGLRMLEGIECASFQADTGFDLLALAGVEIERLIALGMLAWSDTRLHLTRAGLLVSDSIWPFFLRM